MDWNAFLSGVGATAAVAASVVGLVKYFQGRARVVVEVVCEDYYLPPSLRNLITYAASTECKSMLARHLESAEPELHQALAKLTGLGSNTHLLELTQNWGKNTYWYLHVTNYGHEQAQKLELQLPYVFESLLLYSNQTEEVINDGTIRIPELRPGESVWVLGWSDKGAYRPRFLQASGKATIRFQEHVDSRIAKIYRFFRSSPILLTVMLINLLMSIGALAFIIARAIPRN